MHVPVFAPSLSEDSTRSMITTEPRLSELFRAVENGVDFYTVATLSVNLRLFTLCSFIN